MNSHVQKSVYVHDAFISYSRKDKEFAKRLEKALEDYKPPKDLKAPQRNLSVFRDEEDFTGVEYNQSVAKHLKDSKKLIVLCSPNSRKSEYVNEEIRQFAGVNGAGNIIPVLVSGIPNNEAKPGQEDEMAFPEALCKVMEMPLATDYRSFDIKKDKVNKGIFYGPWYTILANIYNISRDEIEHRDKKRQVRRRNSIVGFAILIIVALSGLSIWAVISRKEAVEQQKIAEERRQEAVRQRNIALVRQLAAQALFQHEQGGRDGRAALLARQAYLLNLHYQTHMLSQVDNALRTVLSGSYFSSLLGGKDKVSPNILSGGDAVYSIALSPDGKTIASGSRDGIIRLGDMANPGVKAVALSGHNIEVTSVAFSPDGKALASGSWDRTIRLWDLSNTDTKPKVLRGHMDYVHSVAFSPDGKTLASGSEDLTVRLWNLSDLSAESKVLGGHESGINSVAFSPDGKTLASGSWDNTIRLWDMAKPSIEPVVLRGHEDRVISVAFSPDGKTLTSGSWDRTIRLWDLSNPGAEPKVLRGHERGVLSVAFSPDGKTLASGDQDGIIRLWDLSNPDTEPVVLHGHEEGVFSVAFSPDGKKLASGSWNKPILIWVSRTEALADLVCKKVFHNLSPEEWQRFVSADLPYQLTCSNRPLHPGFIKAGEDLARSGNIDGAVAVFERAMELDPDLVMDPKVEARRFAAQGMVTKGRNLAGYGDVDGAVTLFRKALGLDPSLRLDPEAEANKLAVSGLIKKGRNLARYDVDGAISSFRRAKELDPSLDIDPEAKVKKLAAPGLITRGELLVEQGKVKEAIAAYSEAQKLDPEIKISAESWNTLCRNGSLWGHAADVLNACEQAVAVDPDNAGSWDSRGVARALTGDINGAIEDFETFIDWIDNDGLKSERQRWVDDLRAGKNPFTPEEIEKLRKQ